MKKVYYAHCKALYGTKQETRDVQLLKDLGFQVINPAQYEQEYRAWQLGGNFGMKFWTDLACTCDALAFRSLPDRSLTAGVAKEIKEFRQTKRPIIELPSFFARPILTVEDTRAYLKESGHR